MSRPAKKTAALDADKIIGEIAEGSTQLEIAAKHGVSVGALNAWLHADPERSARARDAMKTSAEAWLDRGLEALTKAKPDTAEIARARAIEQHCARRAAIRYPAKYGDKVAIGGAEDLPPIKSESNVNITPEEAYKRMIGGG